MASKTNTKRLVLLDTHAILHRAYHALPDFSTHGGEPTGALFGLSSMLMKIIDELSPDYIAAAYDLPEPTYRHEVFKEYKATREKTDDTLSVQIDASRDIFGAFGIPIYEKAGFEADDVLGTIVEQTKNEKSLEVIIASGDMDTLQLVEKKRVKVYTLRTGIKDTILYDESGVKERFSFPPKLLPDYKGLRGDPSDNIPGIRGIGEKTATTLITLYGPIEKLYSTLAKKPEDLLEKGIKQRIVDLLIENNEEAEFSKMLATIRRDVPISFKLPKDTWRESLDTDLVLNLFTRYEFRILANRFRTLFSISKDESSAEDEELVGERELKEATIALWLIRSDITNPTLEDIYDYTKEKKFSKAFEVLQKQLKEKELITLYETIEKPLVPIVEKMKSRGIKIDKKERSTLSTRYHKELRKLERSIYKHAGKEFNINSPKQLANILYDDLELTPKNAKKTGTGQRSTRESELEKIKDEHPIIVELFSYRELQKLVSTYLDAIEKLIDTDGRLHATFLQAGTTTGRMASQNPNLQNIPIRTELGRSIRKIFVAENGFKLATFDYSQLELRIAAFLSHDEKLIEVFRSGGDVHTTVAAEIFSVPPWQVDSEMRRQAKVINFGIIYGMGVNALRANLGTDRKTAQAFYNEYFKRFSGLAKYLQRIKADTARTGFTKTYFGRRRYFDGLSSPLPFVRAQAERMAINAPIQGTEADIIKCAMSRVDKMIQKREWQDTVHLLLQVHDELVYEIREDVLTEATQEIASIMEGIIPKKEIEGVPLSVDVKVGASWFSVEPR